MGKLVAEQQVQIDLRALKRMGKLYPGANGEVKDIWFGVSHETITVSFWDGLHGVGQTVALEKAVCPFGGERVYFLCPGCGKRRMVLYAGKTDFRCHKCSGLRYYSQTEHMARRLLWKAEKVRRKLEASDDDPGCKNMARPKHMRQKTFERLRLEAKRYYRQGQKLLLYR